VAYDGQDSVSLDTRLQAFVFQVKEYATALSGEGVTAKQPSYSPDPS
jgi:hypothetical protein